jgi:tetratricopeptide repeat protein
MADSQVVSLQQTDGSLPPQALWEDEPLFWNTHSHVSMSSADPAHEGLYHKLADYLSHAAARFPADLPTHTRRLLLHVHRQDGEAAYGALLDLFIALGPKDRRYREHMLSLAADLMDPQRLAALQGHLDTGLGAADVMPLASHSMLSRSVTGSTDLVTMYTEGTESPRRSVLGDVRELIDCGQVEEARHVLESALLSEPDNEELGLELLELYHHTRDRASFLAMQQRLVEKSPQAAETWAAMAALFSV